MENIFLDQYGAKHIALDFPPSGVHNRIFQVDHRHQRVFACFTEPEKDLCISQNFALLILSESLNFQIDVFSLFPVSSIDRDFFIRIGQIQKHLNIRELFPQREVELRCKALGGIIPLAEYKWRM